MFTLFGILLVLAGVAMLIAKYIMPETIIKQQRVRSQDGYGTEIVENEIPNSKRPKFLDKGWIAYMLGAVGIFSILIPFLFFFASPGYTYFLVFPNGSKSAVMTEGIKFRGFAKITEWDKFIDIKVVDENSDMTDITDIEGLMKPMPLMFIDRVTADAKISARFALPEDPEKFIDLAIEFRNLGNLVQTTLIPTVKEVMSNTGYMFAAQDYISGEAQNFRTTYQEQLEGGSYVVNKITNYDTVFEDIQTKGQRKVKQVKTSYTVEKVVENGIPKRVPNEITKNGIIVAQVIVDDIILEATFKQRLEAQRDESAKRQLEQQKVKTAKDAQQRIIAEGERDKAEERVKKEKEQIQTLIAIETDLKKEETNKQLAAIQLETQRLNSQTVRVKADAEAYEIRMKVNAGITPETKLQMELDNKVLVAAEYAKVKWPMYYMPGGSGGGSDPLATLITAGMAKQLGVNVPK